MLTLLSGHSLTPDRLVSAEAMSLSLKERESTASLTPVSMDGIGINSWLKDNDEPGAGIVWRVKSIRTVFATETPEIELEHVINTLRDRLLFGEVKPSDMGGSTTCTARQAVTYILNQQSDWVLGTFDYDSVSNAYKFDGDSLYDALEIVSNTLTDAWWSYDFTTYPFKLNITAKASGVACELRAGRNLTAITKTVDKSAMYTRFYPVGKDDLHLSGGGYVELNTATYGVVSKTETDTSLESAAQLTAWANERLAKHAEPLVNITADGLELSDATGEPLDKLQLGRLCRIPLPEYGGVQIEERITELTYQDKVHQPEIVQITLANSQEDVTRIIADNMKRSGRGGRAAGRQSAEDHAWIEDTDEYVKLTAIAVGGKDSQGNPDWTRISELTVDGNGIDARVTVAEGDIVTHESRISQNENAITAEVTNRENSDTQLAGKLIVQSDQVGLTVTVTDQRSVLSFPSYYRFPATGSSSYVYLDVGTGYYYAWENGAYVRTTYSKVINAGGIVTSINEDNTISTRISSDKVYIGNEKSTTVIAGKCTLSDVTADYIAGKIANVALLGVQSINGQANDSYTSMKSFYGSNYYVGVSGGGGSVSYNNLANGVYDLQITSSGNDYTLQKKNASGGQWVDVGTFSRATSLSGSWSGRNYTVTASPQGATKTGIVYDGLVPTGSVSKSGKNVSRDFIVYSDDGEGSADSIIMTKTATISASAVWDDGWDAALGEITYPSAAASGTEVTTFSITVPKADRSGGESKTFTLSKGSPSSSGGYASVSLSGTVVGRISISNWYSSGYTAGGTAAGVSGSWSGATFTVSRVADTALKSTSCTVSIYPSSTQNLSYGGSVTVHANAGGSSRASVTVNAPSAPSHTITGFDTTAPAGATYDGNTNNSDGYYISGSSYSASVGCVVKGVWNCDGNQRTGYSYLAKVPTIIYKKGWDNGRSALTSYNLYCSSKEYISGGVRCRFTIERSSLPFSEGTTYTFYRT